MSLVRELNRLAGTRGLEAAGAANALAGSDGLETVGALNVRAGTWGLELNEVCRRLALVGGHGDPALDAVGALRSIRFFDGEELVCEDGDLLVAEDGDEMLLEVG